MRAIRPLNLRQAPALRCRKSVDVPGEDRCLVNVERRRSDGCLRYRSGWRYRTKHQASPSMIVAHEGHTPAVLREHRITRIGDRRLRRIQHIHNPRLAVRCLLHPELAWTAGEEELIIPGIPRAIRRIAFPASCHQVVSIETKGRIPYCIAVLLRMRAQESLR